MEQNPELAASVLARSGILYVTGLNIDLAALQSEACRFSFAGSNKITNFPPRDLRASLPQAAKVLLHPAFEAVATALLGRWLNHNSEIFTQKSDSSASIPSSDLHFDKRRTFKVWLYPFDVLQHSGGAMRVVPNSNVENTKRRRASVNLLDFRNQKSSVHRPDLEEKDDLEAGAEEVFGAAGTIFLHDTDAWHGATQIQPGHERVIYRAHTRKVKLLIPFS